MNDVDDSHTPGTDQDDIDEDARIVDSEPDADAVEEPTADQEHEARATAWMMKKWVSVGIVSIGGTLLVVVGLLLASGLWTVPEPLAGLPFVHWAVVMILGMVLLGAFAWTQWKT